MKKLLLLFATMMGIEAYAGDYTYLTFETTDGSKASVAVEELSITISGTMLKTGDLSFEVSNLSKMYFSTSDESTGIGQVSLEELNGQTVVYDLNGIRLTKEQVKKGVYLVKGKDKTYKIVVR